MSSPSELSLNLEPSLLRKDEEIAVAVAERTLPHRLVPRIDVDRKPLAHGRVAVSGDGLQALDEVGLAAISRDVEWVPR